MMLYFWLRERDWGHRVILSFLSAALNSMLNAEMLSTEHAGLIHKWKTQQTLDWCLLSFIMMHWTFLYSCLGSENKRNIFITPTPTYYPEDQISFCVLTATDKGRVQNRWVKPQGINNTYRLGMRDHRTHKDEGDQQLLEWTQRTKTVCTNCRGTVWEAVPVDL